MKKIKDFKTAIFSLFKKKLSKSEAKPAKPVKKETDTKRLFLLPNNLLTYHLLVNITFLIYTGIVLQVIFIFCIGVSIYFLFPLENTVHKVIYEGDFSKHFTIVDFQINDENAVALSLNYLDLLENVDYQDVYFSNAEDYEILLKKLESLVSVDLYEDSIKKLRKLYLLVVNLSVKRFSIVSDAEVISSSNNERVVQINGKIIEDYYSFKETIAYNFVAKVKVATTNRFYAKSDVANKYLGLEVQGYELDLKVFDRVNWENKNEKNEQK